MGSSWKPRAGVSRHGNPYAGIGPWSANGPRKDRGGSHFGMMVVGIMAVLVVIGLAVILWPLGLLIAVALCFVPWRRRVVARQKREAFLAAAKRGFEANPALREQWENGIRQQRENGVPIQTLREKNGLSRDDLNDILTRKLRDWPRTR